MNGEQNGELPEGWVCAPLADGLALNIQPGFACGANSRDESGFPHLRPMNVTEDGLVSLEDLKYIPFAEANRDSRQLQKGDVLFNNTNSPALVGKTAHYSGDQPRAFSNHMTRIRTRPEVLEPRFCAMFLHQLWREKYFEGICNNHVGQSSISSSALAGVPILLPPLAEQRRIVAAVETVLAKVNAARERLNRVPAILKRFRQAVLSAACSGRLTEEWRAIYHAAEPARTLLEAMARERERAWTSRNASRRYGLPDDMEGEDLSEIPESWVWTNFDHCSWEITVGHVGPMKDRYTQDGIPFLRSQNVRPLRFEPKGLVFIGPEFHASLRKSALTGGEILVTRSGANTGDCCVYPSNAVKANCADLVVTRPLSGLVAEYGAIYISSPDGQTRIGLRETGMAQPHFNIGAMRVKPFPLPPLPEQKEIVRRVSALFALADRIEARLTDARQMADQLTQAVLAKAFRGELVPTEAELARRENRPYESGAELLARIRVEREKAAASNPTRRRRQV